MRGWILLLTLIILSSSINALVFTVTEGELVKLKLKATDPDGNSLTYNFSNPLNEKGEWQTQIGDAGTYNIVISVSDGEKVTKEGLTLIVKEKKKVEEPKEEVEEEQKKEIEEEIEEVNNPPKLEKIEDITVIEGDLVKISPIAVDEDNDKINYGFAYPLNEKGGWQTKIGDSGEYIITVTATDQKSVDSKTFKIIVKKKKKEINFEKINDIILKENEEINLELKASVENENIEFFVENMPNGATLSGNTFYFKPDYNYIGRNFFINLLNKIYHYIPKKSETVTFIARSGNDKVTQNVKVIVTDVNRAPTLYINDIEINEGEIIKFNPIINDSDGDWLKIKYIGDIKNNYQTNFDDSGEYKVKVTVLDPFTSVSKDINVIINNVNRKPELELLDFRKINEKEKLNFKLSASDPDKDKLSYYIVDASAGVEITNDVFSWIPNYDSVKKKKKEKENLISRIKYFNKKNEKINEEVEIKLGVSDGNLTDEKSFKVVVFNVNQKPRIIKAEPEEDIIIARDGRIIFSIDVEDLDNDELIYKWNFGFMNSLEAGNKIARTFTRRGLKTIKVRISDGVDEVEKSWKVRVI